MGKVPGDTRNLFIANNLEVMIDTKIAFPAFLLENMIEKKMLVVPDEKAPLCMWGVRN